MEMDDNMDIHDKLTEIPEQFDIEIEQDVDTEEIEDDSADEQFLGELLFKIKNCPTYYSLYDMEDCFNRVGLTLQITTKNRIILCKIKNNKPYCKNVMDDYMFIGCLSEKDCEISSRMIDCITNFVRNSASGPSEILDIPRKWQDGTRLYGNIAIVNEDVNRVLQGMDLIIE